MSGWWYVGIVGLCLIALFVIDLLLDGRSAACVRPVASGRRRQRLALINHAAGKLTPAAAAERRVTVQIHPSLVGVKLPSSALSLQGPDEPTCSGTTSGDLALRERFKLFLATAVQLDEFADRRLRVIAVVEPETERGVRGLPRRRTGDELRRRPHGAMSKPPTR